MTGPSRLVEAARRPGSLLALGLLLAASSLYLAARADASLLYYANVALHVALGLLLAALVLPAARARFAELSPAFRSAAWLFLGATLSGLFLVVFGAGRAHRGVVWVHAALAAAALLAAAFGLRRALPGVPARAGLLAFSAAGLALLALPARVASDLAPPVRRIANPALPPASMAGEGDGEKSPFFPSSARTSSGGVVPANFFMTSDVCARCHEEIAREWDESAHHFSSFNNQWYRKSIEYMQDVVGTRPSKWCAGCHDHAVFFNGRFDRPIREQIDTPEAQNGLGCTSCHAIAAVHSTMGQGDFTVDVPPLHDLAASRNPFLRVAHDALLRLEPEPHRRTFLKSFHEDQTAEFCSSCHKVHLDEPVNAYRWFRGFNDYDAWQASGVSGEGARSFYEPKSPMKCKDCHMPLVASSDPAATNGKVRSHRFLAANTALPFVNGHADQLRMTQEFLRDGAVTVDLFGMVRDSGGAQRLGGTSVAGPPVPPLAGSQPGAAAAEPMLSTTFGVGEESGAAPVARTGRPVVPVVGPLDKVDAVVARGESVRLDVVVRTRKVGHFFPGGTVDAFDTWLEVEARDSNGRPIFHSGFLEGGNGPVEPGAHRWRSLMLDARGNPIDKRNAWATRSVAFVRLIPPGAADTVHYRLEIPEECGDSVTITAKVNHRKFAWWNTQWSYAGVRDPSEPKPEVTAHYDDGRWVFAGDTSRVSGGVKAIPDLPVTVMAEAKATLRVIPKGAAAPSPAPFEEKSVRERWNDYGIGLLLQGDLRAAEAAFLAVTRMEPTYADGFVNVARVRLAEGDVEGGEEMARKALAVAPDLPKARFFLAQALKGKGLHEEALAQLRIVAARFPRDRVVRNQAARALFHLRRFNEASEELKAVFAVDPEDLQGHYTAMLAERGRGDAEAAARHERLYRRFKADESAQAITGDYRRLHPHDNNERQAIHEHRSSLAAPDGVTRVPAYAAAPKPAKGAAVRVAELSR